MKLRRFLTAAVVGVALPTLTLIPAPAAATPVPNTPVPDAKALDVTAPATTAGPFWWASGAVSESNRMVIDVEGPSTANYAKVHLWDWYGGASQYWYLDSVTGQSSNTRLLRNKYSGKCMVVQGTGVTNGTPINQMSCDYGDRRQMWRQEFRFSGDDKSYYRFVNIATGKCLDNTAGGTALGNKIQIWSCSSGTNYNQLWY
ncbi:RICIN domain-containing protein [Nonomuraea sp. NPDC046570]|uniref:RICIN domain-containing protein n=1 Tax=Nonomuraea sp. NPDC046570 TaxID=3155255 RepID=UPI0033C7B681